MMDTRPGRYGRSVDALLIEDLVDVVCKKPLYDAAFKPALEVAFPHGNEEARTFLERITIVRNPAAHANPISVRQAEQVICYVGDVIDSLRAYFASRAMSDEYNAPRLLRMWDSLGNEFRAGPEPVFGASDDFGADPKNHLRPGDTLSIEIELDPAYDNEGIKVLWAGNQFHEETTSLRWSRTMTNADVAQAFILNIHIISNKPWHRFGSLDDGWHLLYRVLPPVT